MKGLVVGLGSVGIRHFTNLKRLGIHELSVCRTRNRPLYQPVDLGDVDVFTDYEKALSQGPDLVIVANPTSMHSDYAYQAMKAGAHVYIEKPVSDRLDNVTRLYEVAKEKRLICQVGCQLRFDETLIAVSNWVRSGRLGTIFSVFCDMGEYLPDWHPWEDYRDSYAARRDLGGGVVLTVIHEFDYLYWLFGPFKQVFAFGGSLTSLGLDVEDTVLATLLSRTDIPIQLRMDYWRKPRARKMNIVGANGEIDWDYYAGKAVLKLRGEDNEIVTRPEEWERNDLFVGIMSNFIDSIKGLAQPRIPLQDSIEVLKTALAVRESMYKSSAMTLN